MTPPVIEGDFSCASSGTYLVFRVQGDNASFVRTHNYLACAHYVGARFSLQLVRDQQKQKAALQEVDSEEEWHEA